MLQVLSIVVICVAVAASGEWVTRIRVRKAVDMFRRAAVNVAVSQIIAADSRGYIRGYADARKYPDASTQAAYKTGYDAGKVDGRREGKREAVEALSKPSVN